MKSKPLIILILVALFTSFPNKVLSQDIQPEQYRACLNSTKHDTLKIMAMYFLYMHYFYKRTDSALYFAKNSYLLSKKNGDYELGRLAMALGHAYDNVGDYEKSIIYLTEAYDIAKSQKYEKAYSLLLNDIGTNYLNLKDYIRAEEYFKKALKLIIDYDGKLVTYFNLAQVSCSLGKYEEAIKYYQLALEATKLEGNIQDEAIVYNGLGFVFYDKKDYKTGIDYYKKALSLFDSANIYYQITSHSGLAEGYFLTGDYKTALKHCYIADSLSDNAGFINNYAYGNKLLSEIYEKQGNMELALEHYKIYTVINDSLINEDKNDRISYLYVEFETKEKDLQLEIMQKDAALKNRMIIIYFILSCFIFTVFILLLKSIKSKNRKLKFEKEKEQFQKQKLELELNEKHRELLSNSMYLNQQKNLLSEVQSEVENIISSGKNKEFPVAIVSLNNNLKSKIKMSDNWEQINLHFEKVHPGFFNGLKKDFPDLSITELKLCAYTKLNFSTKEIGELLNINQTSVRMARYRLKKKMNIAEEMNFNDFVLSQY